MELTVNVVLEILKEYFKLNNYSKVTEIQVVYYLKQLDRFVRNELKITDYRDIKEDDYYKYVSYLKKEKGEDVKLHHHNVHLRRIFRILENEEKILVDPFAMIEPIKMIRNIRDKVLSENEIFKLLEAPDISKPIGFRNRVIIEVLYGTGLRASELCNLEIQDFLMEERLLFVKEGKGKKDRILPLGDNAYRYLSEYVKRFRKKLLSGKKTKSLFIFHKGRSLNVYWVRAIIKSLVKKSGLEKEVTPHVIRHTFATHLLKRGAGIREIQILLGHSSISSTQVYINLNQDHLKEEYEKYHPLENELYFDVYGREEKVIKDELLSGIYQVNKS